MARRSWRKTCFVQGDVIVMNAIADALSLAMPELLADEETMLMSTYEALHWAMHYLDYALRLV